MKKYKLIKCYPGCPDLGYITKPHTKGDEGSHYWMGSWFNPQDFPEFWEEIIEIPEYVKVLEDMFPLRKGDICKVSPEGIIESERYKNYYDKYTWKESESKYWSKSTKKEYDAQICNYQILTFKYLEGFTTLRDNGYYVYNNVLPEECSNGKGATLEEMLDKSEFPDAEIYSVKRLSDGEIFTIGDTLVGTMSWKDGEIKIKRFVLDTINNTINIEHCTGRTYYAFKKGGECVKVYKKPLFTTEDGVNIFEGGEYWFVIPRSFRVNRMINATKSSLSGGSVKRFSTKQLAEEYIDMNKPQFSFNQIKSVFIKIGLPENYERHYKQWFEEELK